MAKEIEELRKMIEKQNEKYRSLEEENINLKNNIKVLGKI
jgi:cell division protein FtsB